MTPAGRSILSVLIGLAGSAALVAAATPASPGRIQAAPRPAIAILDLSPLVVRGTYFKSNERVRVVAAVPGPNPQRVVRAGSTGRFRLSFRRTIACSSNVVVFAYGALGSKALRIVPPGTAPSCAS